LYQSKDYSVQLLFFRSAEIVFFEIECVCGVRQRVEMWMNEMKEWIAFQGGWKVKEKQRQFDSKRDTSNKSPFQWFGKNHEYAKNCFELSLHYIFVRSLRLSLWFSFELSLFLFVTFHPPKKQSIPHSFTFPLFDAHHKALYFKPFLKISRDYQLNVLFLHLENEPGPECNIACA